LGYYYRPARSVRRMACTSYKHPTADGYGLVPF
jgi:hypothetical protein